MDNKEDVFLKRLQSMFQVEAEEHINILSSGLIELEKNQEKKKSLELIETIFREAHSLKGAARSVNRMDIESICQVLESTFARLKNEKFFLSAEQFDLIHEATDTLSKLVSGAETKMPGVSRQLIKKLKSIAAVAQPGKKNEEQLSINNQPSEETSQVASPAIEMSPSTDLLMEKKRVQLETVRIPTVKLDPLFLQAEQMIQSTIAVTQRAAELRSINDFIGLWKTESRKRDNRQSSESGLQLKEIFDWNNEKLNELEGNVAAVMHSIENDQRLLGRMIDEHLESMKKILMLPVSSLIEGFPKLVRDLARSQGKEVVVIVNGKEIEVDKRILDDLKDPLIHLIRNCIDHGIKKPEERLKINKPVHGTITLNFIATDSRHLEISISDDGAGINSDKVIASAIKTGILSKDNAEKLSAQETLALIFKSGITTSAIITDISGRGLGLAIVSDKVEKLGGTVSVESLMNTGTTFRLFLPLTLSAFRGVLVRTGEHLFFIPTVHVKRAVKVSNEDIRTIENRETIALDKEILAVVKLSDVLGLNDRTNAPGSQKGKTASASDFFQIIVLKQGDKQIGFKVDEVFDEHQILIKELGKQLSRVRNIGGAAVLGSGTVVPVINVSDLMKSAVKEGKDRVNKGEEKTTEKIYKILVIEDSITSRTLIKDILETAGYRVETAVDGVDGYTKACIGEFDLIVSDVDMPRMNGFELTTKIRKDKKLYGLPVVLVTALESREDREQGIDVGANAYIVKSSFDQSNLLDVINKLL
jgi:two-component system chemotaxis sensor kinase CheA